jgi:hypothetical protein
MTASIKIKKPGVSSAIYSIVDDDMFGQSLKSCLYKNSDSTEGIKNLEKIK